MKSIMYVSLIICLFSSLLFTQNYRERYAEFNGGSSYVTIPFSNSDPDLSRLNNEITIEAYIQVNSFVNYPTIVGKNYTRSFWFGFNPQGYLRFYPMPGQYVESTTPVNIGDWIQVAVTYDGTYSRFYLNGFLQNVSAPITGPRTFDDDTLYIGCDRTNDVNSYFFSGKMNYVRLWQGARSQEEIQRDMNVCLAVFNNSAAYSGLVSVQNFNGNSKDLSGTVYNDGYNKNITFGVMGTEAYSLMQFNSHLWLDGSSSCGLPYSSLQPATTSITVEAWIKKDYSGNQPIYQDIISKSGGARTIDFALSYLHPNRIKFEINNVTGSTPYEVIGDVILDENKWYHVSATYNMNTGNMYVLLNGNPVSGTNIPQGVLINNNEYPIIIGGNGCSDYPDYKFKGGVDGIRIWANTERSDLQIREDMYKSFDDITNADIGHIEVNFDRNGLWAFMPNLAIGALTTFGSPYVKATTPGNLIIPSPMLFNQVNHDFQLFYRKPTIAEIPGIQSVTIDSINFDLEGVVNSIKAFLLLTKENARQLNIKLISPDGTEVILCDNTALPDPANSIMTVFDDEAIFSINGSFSPYSPRVKPASGNFNPFIGTNAQGWWKLRIENFDQNTTPPGVLYSWGFQILAVNGLETESDKADQFLLSQNFPNPFNPETVIKYQIPTDSHVSLKIFDVLGNEVANLVDEMKEAGNHAIHWKGNNVPSGVYFYQISAGDYKNVKKMMLLK
ncbi:MAG: LamG-like jellyroll fold domain-containing protein [Ignavibacteriaceae bacterium]